jgi:DNA-binding NtrC family response regulator
VNRQRILLLENDGPTESLLCDLFEDEGLDVTVCGSLAELLAGVAQCPQAAVVSDPWAKGEYHTLTPQHGAEIVALAGTAEIILTTCRVCARHIQKGELGTATIVEKPYDLNRLMIAVHASLQRGRREFAN